MGQPTEPPSVFHEWIAGAISGGAGVLVGNPLDVIKVRLQVDPNVKRTKKRIWPQIRALVLNEGISSLIQGAFSPVVSVAALNSMLFVSYTRTLAWLNPSASHNHSLTDVSIAGMVAGIACFTITTPTELIKCRMQAQYTNPNHRHTELYIRELESIYRTENGLRGFYRGGLITLVRDGPGYAVYFGTYELLKRELYPWVLGDYKTQQAQFWAGGLAGVLSWAAIYPIDVVKSRVQVSSTQHGSIKMLASVSRNIYMRNGLRGFVIGIRPTLVRAFFVNAVTFLTYEQLISGLT